MTDYLILNIALSLVCVVLVGTIVAAIVHYNYDNTTASEGTQACSCDNGTTHMQDLALMQCFYNFVVDDRVDEEIKVKAKAALLGILEDYVPEEGGATAVTAPEEKA